MQQGKHTGRKVIGLLWILLWVETGGGLPCEGQEHPQPVVWEAAASAPQSTGKLQDTPRSLQWSFRFPQVLVKEGQLSVALHDVPVRKVLEAIANQSGIRTVLMAEGVQATLTDTFDALPLAEGLRRLLRGMSYTFVYADASPARRLTQVYVMLGSPTQPDHDKGVSALSPLMAPVDGEPGTAALAVMLAQLDAQPVENPETRDILPDLPQMSAELIEGIQPLTEALLYQLQNPSQ